MATRLEQLFANVARAFERHAANQERAANIGEIWNFVQEQLVAEYMLENPGFQQGMSEIDMAMACPCYVLDVYVNDKGVFALVTKSDGKLYKIPVTVGKDNIITLGETIEVFMEALPVTGRQVTVKRQSDGVIRWFAMPACTAVLNRSGEIDSCALFDNFIEHIMRTQDYPELDFYHLGEAILLGRADFVWRDGVAYCATGTFYDTDIARAAAKSLEDNQAYWGLSIAYAPTSEPGIIRSEDGVKIPVYNSGINRFISLLPEKDAASILTSISTKEEVNRMNAKAAEALRVLTGGDEELINAYQLKIDTVNRSAQGMISRNDGLTTAVPVVAVSAPVSAAPVTPLEAPAAVEVRAMSTEDMTALLADPAFEARVKEIITQVDIAEAQAIVDASAAATKENAREITQLGALVRGLNAKVTGMINAQTEEAQQLQDDKPAKILSRQNQAIVRPRTAVSVPEKNTLAEVAQSGMEKLRQQKAAAQS